MPCRVMARSQVPQYETDEYYATTGFATTIDEAAKKATRYMIDYLVETVDVPHMLVTMHMPKHIFADATLNR